MPAFAVCLRDARGEYVPISLTAAALAVSTFTLLSVLVAPIVAKATSRIQEAMSAAAAAVTTLVAQAQPPAQKRPSTMSVLREVRQAGALGLDVGGTLAKLVMAEPTSSGLVMPDAFGEDGEDGEPEGRTHRTLDLRLRPRWGVENEAERRLQFVSGSSDGLTELLGDAFGEQQEAQLKKEEAQQRATQQREARSSAKSDDDDAGGGALWAQSGPFGGQRGHRRTGSFFAEISTALLGSTPPKPSDEQSVQDSPIIESPSSPTSPAGVAGGPIDPAGFPRRRSRRLSKSGSGMRFLEGPPRRVAATGGGAHKLKAFMQALFNIELTPVPEMDAVILGMLAMHALKPKGELFTVEEDASSPRPLPADFGATAEDFGSSPRAWPEHLFPFLLVNIGSGVSVLRVDGLRPPAVVESGTVTSFSSQVVYTRVGGTACGGATFLGLAKLLTHRPDMSFEEALELASFGNSSNVDKVVGDIYGVAGSASLGLPASLTAASFGKLVRPPPMSRAATPAMSPAVSHVSSRLPSRQPSRPNSPRQQRRSASLADAAAIAAQANANAPSAAHPSPSAAAPHDGTPTSAERSTTTASWPPSDADVVAGLLDMVVQASAVLAKAHVIKSADSNKGERVYFSGGFVSSNPLARAALARSLRALGCEALFFRHSDFLGALGALSTSWPGGADAFRANWMVAEPTDAPEVPDRAESGLAGTPTLALPPHMQPSHAQQPPPPPNTPLSSRRTPIDPPPSARHRSAPASIALSAVGAAPPSLLSPSPSLSHSTPRSERHRAHPKPSSPLAMRTQRAARAEGSAANGVDGGAPNSASSHEGGANGTRHEEVGPAAAPVESPPRTPGGTWDEVRMV